MAISPDLLLAILSLDSYNRGYGEGIEGLGGVGSKVGPAKIIRESDTQKGSEEVSAGFYAVAYDTPYGTVISYRGTDKNISSFWKDEPGSDLWNGYGTGAGFSTNDQAHLAAEFFQAVTGTSNADPRQGRAILTGYSLGGGLAGFVGAIYHQEGVLFDNMPFEMAANDAYFRASKAVPGFVDIISQLIWNDFYNGLDPWPPKIGNNLQGYHVPGEFLQALRVFQKTPSKPVGGADEVTNLKAFGSPFTGIHSMSILTILMFFDKQNSSDWREIYVDLGKSLFNDEISLFAGYDKLQGTSKLSDKMRNALSYSIFEGDGLVFGDTAIRALFDDADEVGRIAKSKELGLIRVIEGDIIIENIVKILVQFAGQMALREVTKEDYPDAVKGVVRASDAGDFLSVSIDRKAKAWKTSLLKEKSSDAKKYLDVSKIVGVDAFREAVDAYLARHEVGAEWRARVADKIRNAEALVVALAGVGSLDVDEATGLLKVSKGRAEKLLSNEKKPRTLVVGTDGQDEIIDGAGDDVILAGEGHDTITATGGDDVFIGGAGIDVVDYGFAGGPLKIEVREGLHPVLQTPHGVVVEVTGGEHVGRDLLLGVEEVYGEDKRDHLIIHDVQGRPEEFRPTFDLKDGVDRVDMSKFRRGAFVDLGKSKAQKAGVWNGSKTAPSCKADAFHADLRQTEQAIGTDLDDYLTDKRAGNDTAEKRLLDGGAGNDNLIAAGGKAATTLGGTGRDWIVNRSGGGGALWRRSGAGVFPVQVGLPGLSFAS